MPAACSEAITPWVIFLEDHNFWSTKNFTYGEKKIMSQEMEPDPSVIEEAIAVIRGGLGKAELEFVASLTTPIFWVLRDSSGKEMVRNGSLFFLDAGEGAFELQRHMWSRNV